MGGVFQRLEAIWYGEPGWGRILAPLSLPWSVAARVRRALFRRGMWIARQVGRPVVVVGNLAVGGTGKTPFVIWLVERLRARGYRPGVVCSGYRGRSRSWPRQVHRDSDPGEVGDEPVLIAKRCACPVVAGPDRVEAARTLVRRPDCDFVVADDGLQHYRLARDIEIAMLDGVRRHGTGLCLPAGPLREPVSRLASVDFVVAKGNARPGEHAMVLEGRMLRRVVDEAVSIEPAALPSPHVFAVAGIGHPDGFFGHLATLGLRVTPRTFPDHHTFSEQDIEFEGDAPVIMTEKDAVKCRRFAGPRHWYLPVTASLSPSFESALFARIAERSR